MGFFGGDKNNQPVQADNTSVQDPAAPSLDGILPPATPSDDQAMQQTVDDYMAQDDQQLTASDAVPADYIFTDPDDTEHDYHEPTTGDTIPVHTTHPVQADTTPDDAPDDLHAIRQQALQQLSPLVAHLDQSPEEKFHTTMMMLQATDDQSLVKTAYEAAQAITNEKARAQALLDVVNEINYFTQQKG